MPEYCDSFALCHAEVDIVQYLLLRSAFTVRFFDTFKIYVLVNQNSVLSGEAGLS